MPTYQGQVSEEGLIDLVEYIKTLKSNYRNQQTLVTTQVQRCGADHAGYGEAMSTTIVSLPGPAHSDAAEDELPEQRARPALVAAYRRP